MALQVDDVIRVDYRGTCYGQRIILTTGYRVTVNFTAGGSVSADLGLILNTIALGGVNDVPTFYLQCLQNAYTLEEVRAQVVFPIRSAYRSVFYAADNAGSGGVGTVANDSAAITLRGPLAGRKNVSTKHIGPVPDSVSANGLLTNPYKVKLQALINALGTTMTPAGNPGRCLPVIINKFAASTVQWTDARIGAQSRVQRRRTVGLGE